METKDDIKSNQVDTGTYTACPRELHCYVFVLEIGNYYDHAEMTRIFLTLQAATAAIPKGFNERPDVTAWCYYGHDEIRGKWASIKRYELE
jgi:hypothetical protein